MVRSFLARSSLRVVSEILGSASRPESLCLACRLRRVSPPVHASFSTSAARAESLSITERIRRKIWGTDQPPGQADPYARLDESEKAREAQARLVDEEKRKKAAAADELPDGYEPATTWDGLEEVGTFETVEEEWTRRHPYEGYVDNWSGVVNMLTFRHRFMTATRLTTPQELTAALHRAVIEVYTLEEAGRPLSSLRKDPGSDDLTGSVQAAPSSDLQGATLVYPGDSVRVEILRSLSKESVNSKRSDDLQTSVASSKSPAGTEPVEPDAASIAIANEGASEASSESPEQRLDETTPEINQAENQISSWDPSWLSIPLKTVDLKFAVCPTLFSLVSTC